jgi:hypothetical protein
MHRDYPEISDFMGCVFFGIAFGGTGRDFSGNFPG